LGIAQLISGEANQAVATFSRAVTLLPQSAASHYRLAAAKAMVQDFKGAEAALTRALALKPDYQQATVTLGYIKAQSGKPDDALQLARQLQKSKPKAAGGYLMEGDILYSQGKFAAATKAFEAALARQSNTHLVLRVYRAQVRAQNVAAGDALLEKWVLDHPDDLEARLYRADSLRQSRNSQGAKTELEYITKKTPADVNALIMLAWTYHDLGDRARSAEISAQLLNLKPQDPAIMDSLGCLMVKHGKPREALSILETALKRRPSAPEIRYHLGVALANSGDKAGARKEIDQALAAGKGFREIDEAKAFRTGL
jgi:Flp pilus assembly protein TadD